MSDRAFIRGASAALLDQGWLSVVNLVIGLSFIRFALKADYGIYVQLFAALMLSTSVQNALITTPLTTLGAKRDPTRQAELTQHLFWLQFSIALFLACFAGAGILLLQKGFNLPGMTPVLALTFALCVLGTWLREYLRHYEFLHLRAGRVFVIDGIFGVVLLLFIVATALQGRISVELVFGAMAAANLIAVAWGVYRSDLRVRARRAAGGFRNNLVAAWDCGRWTLPSVFITWGYSQSYVYIAAAVIGVHATAEIAAARLLLSPIVLASTAWGKVFLPRASRWLGDGQVELLKRTAWSSLFVLCFLVVAYLGALMLGYPWLEAHILGENYAGLELLILLWGLYFLLKTAETVGTHCLLSGEWFQRLFVYSLIALAIGLPATVLFSFVFRETGTLIGLVSAAAVMFTLVWFRGWPQLQRSPLWIAAQAKDG